MFAAIGVGIAAGWFTGFALTLLGVGAGVLFLVLSLGVGIAAGIWYRQSHRGWDDLK
jgi:hypothetical protein